MKKFICMLTALVLTAAVLFSGCGSAAKDESFKGNYPEDANMNREIAEDMDFGGVGDEAPAMKGELLTAQNTSARKIIRNASADIQTENSLELYKRLSEWAQTNGGYEDSKNQFKSGDSTVVEATLRLPPDKVDGFLEFAAQSGEVINCNIDSQDITDEYYDVQTRLVSKRKSLQSYYDLLKKAATVEEIGTVQNYINQITEEIESLEGRIKMWDSQVNYATVRVYIREYTDAVKIKKEIKWNTMTFDDMLYMMKNGALSVVNTIVSALQWILILLIAASPVLLPLAVVVFILYRRRKKKKAAQADAEKQKKE